MPRRRRRSNPLWFTLAIIGVGLALAQYDRCQRLREPQDGTPDAILLPANRDAAPTAPATPDGQATLGLPGPADVCSPDRLLIDRPQYVISYNAELGIPNWVAWHVGREDIGPAERGQFAPDQSLPRGVYRVAPNDYKASGFDRGHMCPSGDRTATPKDNAATFMMTNIVPQAPDNNQGPWADLENYCRELVRKGNEIYVAAGGAGPFDRRIANGKVAVPASVWKVVVVLPEGSGDLGRVTTETQVFAVSMPNRDGIRDDDWRRYLVSVDAIESATGLDVMPSVPAAVQAALESRVDAGR